MKSATPTAAAATPARPAGAPWTYADARAFLGLSERSLFRLIAAGQVRVIRLGKKPMVPDGEVRRLAADGC